MHAFEKNIRPPQKGQGALEYLLLIGGAVLVATIVLIVILGSTSGTNAIINNNIGQYQSHISLNSAGGGGSGAVCGNGTIEGSEQCDGAALGGNTCTTIGGGFTGGTLSCSGSCTFNTSACTGAPPDTSPPSFASFAASTTNAEGTAGAQVGLSWTASDATPPVVYDLARETGVNTELTTSLNTTSTFMSGTSNVTYAVPASSPYSDSASLLVGQTYYYNMMYCDSVTPTPYCEVYPGTPLSVVPWQAKLIEPEAADVIQAGLATVLYVDSASESQMTLHDSSGACNTGIDNVADFTVGVNWAPHLNNNIPYKGWVRAVNVSAASRTIMSTLAGATPLQSAIPANTTAYTWVASSANSNIMPSGSLALNIRVPCGTAGVTDVYVDKILVTTDLLCTPTGLGANCV
jgi:hypothetical protein